MSTSHFARIWIWFTLLVASLHSLSALEQADQWEIQEIIKDYTASWNEREGWGFADHFTEDGDFVNLFGTHFSGRAEIENRHVKILQTFLKDSKLEILSLQLREVQAGLIIALVRWRLQGYHNPHSYPGKPANTRDGIFTQVFIHSGKKWEITASQNTLIPNE